MINNPKLKAKSKEENSLEPLLSPSHEDVPMWNILPSYQLYQSTFSKNISLSNEDLAFEPPKYEDAPESTDYFSGVSLPPTQDRTISPTGSLNSAHSTPINGINEIPTRYENSIHGNSHKLKRLGHTKSCLSIAMEVTRKLGKLGEAPEIIDPKTVEFTQGDTINGFVTVTNQSSKPVPFSMFFVVFEGKISVRKPGGGDINDPKYTLIFYKFLNMFDYNASWTPADIDSTFNEVSVDPFDNSVLKLKLDRVFEPGIKYKKFFSFKIPEKLLDCACEDHNLQYHCEAPPSIGLPRDQFLLEVRKLRRGQGSHGKILHQGDGLDEVMKSTIKDFSFPDTAISYSVEVRVVGKASDHPDVFDTTQGDEFIMVEEASCFVRFVPYERINKGIDKKQLLRESRLVYEDLVKRIREVIDLGKELASLRDLTLSPILNSKPTSSSSSSSDVNIQKRPQLYSSKSEELSSLIAKSADLYEVSTNCYKKQISAPKLLGEFIIQTPRFEYTLPYQTPQRFTSFSPQPLIKGNGGINIPLTFIFKPASAVAHFKPPEIKQCSVELIAFTYRSKKYPVAIDIYHDLIFQNKRGKHQQSNDNFDHYVVQPFQIYLEKITNLAKVWGWENLNISKQLILDIKSVSNLQPKCNVTKVENFKFGVGKWSQARAENSSDVFMSKSNLAVDLRNLKGEKGEDCCLLPSFQSCIIGRLYYLKVSIHLQHAEPTIIKIPISIEKSPSV
ncbi:hypothetical protein CLIB1423_02S11870 [[Candida] railenensis]|uniref:Bul1 N-terminal domain-containing protein n=1 Tax=[Candida] railenensis TaxID=45579 RepID=A0A9P0QLZ0_9ASCO|nr:hypothetical protein CLIB1423_02S11870 [[Candida] railenensis]